MPEGVGHRVPAEPVEVNPHSHRGRFDNTGDHVLVAGHEHHVGALLADRRQNHIGNEPGIDRFLCAPLPSLD